MLLPEQIHPALADEPVPFILVVGDGEGSLTRGHVEQDDAEGEQVNDLSLVWHGVNEFRRHIAHGADSGGVEAISIASLNRACKAEVDNFYIELIGQENVLGLEVTMADAVRVEVVEGDDELLEVVAADRLGEWPGYLEDIEEFPSHDRLL